jgi:spore coat protein U-like protein
VSVTIYGRIPPGQDVSVGTYSDTVTVLVLF